MYDHTAAPHSVSDVTVTRTSGTSVMVSWEGLTLTEARGFPLYLVLLKSEGDESGMENITKLTTNTSAVITDLDPATTYEVSVTVHTGAGLSHGAESAKGEIRTHTDLSWGKATYVVEVYYNTIVTLPDFSHV